MGTAALLSLFCQDVSVKILVIFLLVVSCAHQAPKKKQDSNVEVTGTPDWVYAPEKLCKRKEFCAVGSGTGLAVATTNARVAIARIFETKVQSVYKQSLSSDNKGEDQMSLSEDVKEITEGVLSGVEIRKTYAGQIDVFALGVLNKPKAAKKYKSEVSEIDEQMRVFASDNSLRASMKLKRLLIKRRPLVSRYQVLTGGVIAPPVSFRSVYNKIKNALKDVVVAIKTQGEASKELASSIKKVMTDNDYRLVDWADGAKNFTHMVTGKISYEKQYLKVSGFEKYRFLLEILARNRNGQQVGSVKFEVAETGRNYKQAYDQAAQKINAFLLDNLADLNIE